MEKKNPDIGYKKHRITDIKRPDMKKTCTEKGRKFDCKIICINVV